MSRRAAEKNADARRFDVIIDDAKRSGRVPSDNRVSFVVGQTKIRNVRIDDFNVFAVD